ncbi:glycosyl hydrolase family 18 protein [Solimonas fluminis]|uniref:glycosyl hydrolase family 18 protein n=1 Tax=Solimonas fluminis TaxID=2086571 RepID=UPI001FAF8CED|nr:glycosyl hydrolase family 18 protein [Solimonas fluminis]
MKPFSPALRLGAAALCLAMAPSAQAGLLDNLLEALKPKPVVSFEAAASQVTEGGARTISLKLSRSSTRTVALSYTRGGSAGAADYSATPATIQFAPGETLKTISVSTVDDTQVEGPETLVLTLGTPGYGKLGAPAQHTLTLADNDAAPPTLGFSAATASGSEAQASTVDVVLSAASTQTVTVGYATSGTATRPGDWQVAPSGTLTFTPGQTRKTLTITPVDDAVQESAETAVLTLVSPANATLGNPPVHTRTILDNDAPPAAGKWVTGYYVGYARDLYPLEAVDFSAMTHIVIGRVRPLANGSLATDFDIDAVEGPRWAKQVVAAAHAAGTKAIVMLGGAGEYDGFVGAASNANRARFVANLVALANEYGFDGYDIDWEPIEPKDQPYVKLLAQDLRAAAPGRLLTIPIGWINNNFPEQAEPWYAEIAPLFDQINIMSYGMASGFWGWNTWHSSAIYGETGMTPSSIDSSVRNWLRVGVPAAKLGIGIGFYGSCWRGVTQPYQSTDGVDTGGLPINGNDDNDMSYTNIMTLYYSASAKRWHEAAKAPYLSSATRVGPQQCNFISYEDPQSIAEKALYVKQNGLGGTIVWTINQGYLPNAPAGQRDPLMQALKQGFRSP